MRAGRMRKAWKSIKKLLWWGVCEPLSCCLFFRLLSQSLFRCSPACFARLHWDDSRKQSALVIITSPVSPGFPQESVLVESPRNKVDLRESPGFYESKGGTVVRALASHRSGPGSNLRFNRVSRFSPLLKKQHFQIDLKHADTFKRVLNLKNS